MNSKDYQSLTDEIKVLICKGMNKHKVTGMSIALQDGNDIVWAEGFGYADKKQKRKSATDTLYKAGSISKVFTATAIMQLVEQGKVDLDAPIQTYIPELRPKYHFAVDTPITLRLIMTHRSGLSGDMIAGMFTEHPKHFDTIIDYINSVHSPYAPDTISAYSNIATDLQGVVIERVSGERFEDYMQQHILAPLDMHHSSFDDVRVNQALMSKGYKRNKEHHEYPIRNLPAGNLHSNVIELSRFANMVLHNNGILLKPDTLQQMLRPQADHNDLYDMGMKMGLNWIIERPRLKHLGKVAWHTGGTINFMSSLVILPEQGLSVVVLSNTAMSMEFVEEVANAILLKAAELKSGCKTPEPTSAVKVTPCPSELLAQMPGIYATILGPMKIFNRGRHLKARVLFLKLLLQHQADGWLQPQLCLFGLIRIRLKLLNKIRIQTRDDGEQELLMAEYEGNHLPVGIKVQPVSIPNSWHAAVGKYTVEIPDGDFVWFKQARLQIKDGMLMLSMKIKTQGAGSYILKPISDEMALIEGIGRGMQETIYLDMTDGQPLLSFGGYRYINKNKDRT